MALSLESLPLGVTQHPAPWSSDFPQAPIRRPRPSVLLNPFAMDNIHATVAPRNLRLCLPVELVVGEFVGELVVLTRDVRYAHVSKCAKQNPGPLVEGF